MLDDPISFDIIHPKPLLVILSGPSGVGKDAVLKALKIRDQQMSFVVTATTRPARSEEIEGVDYFFFSKEEFQRMISEDELLEYSLVYNQYKGIPKWQIRQATATGKDVILRIDVQGVVKVRKICPEAVTIFITPANEDELVKRLMERQTETFDSLRLRLETARKELESLPDFDYVVLNTQGELDRCVEDIVTIIKAEHMRVHPREVNL